KDAADFIIPKIQHLTQQKFIPLFLNSNNIIINQKTIFIPTFNTPILHPPQIYTQALKSPTNPIILLHNHPSPDTTPSL
ncbi:JAB domain-containing protein, partial [Staphylococcus saprophyticus]|uniref:JAB domain-containing protein n=1 Tax=Staphylococcus saprophyticus TaxID=29385 RepID=UPI0028CB8F0D